MEKITTMIKKKVYYRSVFTLLILFLSACSNANDGPPLNPIENRGRQVFKQHCAACHSTEPDLVIVGPSLANIATRAETRVEGITQQEYIETSILTPDAYLVEDFDDLMPRTFGTVLAEDEFAALVTYLQIFQ